MSGFGKTCTRYDLTGSDTNKANIIAYLLSLNPEGVAVSFETSSGATHTIVFTGTTYEVPLGYSLSSLGTTAQERDELISIVTQDSINNWVNSYKAKSVRTNSSTYDGLFTVCDPVSTTSLSGNQVLFGNSYTASNYGFSTAYKVVVIN